MLIGSGSTGRNGRNGGGRVAVTSGGVGRGSDVGCLVGEGGVDRVDRGRGAPVVVPGRAVLRLALVWRDLPALAVEPGPPVEPPG